jgi:hypothetical protein
MGTPSTHTYTTYTHTYLHTYTQFHENNITRAYIQAVVNETNTHT